MEDKRKLLNDFLSAFPLETLSDMPLEKYTNLNRSDSFVIGWKAEHLNWALFGEVLPINSEYINTTNGLKAMPHM